MLNIHLIPHTHWDREWYFNTEESRSLLVYFMDELLSVLESDEEFKYFVLDGQAVILDDYLELVPENRERIKRLVKKGVLIIGPWYTQTDQMVVAGESIIRNLYYGIKKCEEFGQWMKIGYVPDSFGQSAQLPQILKGFGIDKAVFWRGIYEKNSPKSEFFWESPDGSRVFAVNLPLGYAIGKYLPHDIQAAKDRIEGITAIIKKRATSDNVLIPNGHDQMPVQKDLTYLVRGLNKIDDKNNYFISNYDKYIESVRMENKNFDTVKGELLYPKYMRVHRSIYSTRYDIKKTNADIENFITGSIEPILTIAWKCGFLYPHAVVEKIWKEIFQCHAHDSIGCCNTDRVNEDIKNRLIKARELCNGILNINIRRISEAIEPERDGQPLVIFNTLPYKRNNVFIETVYVEDEKFTIVDKNDNIIPHTILNIEEIDMGTIDRRIAASNKKLMYKKCTIAVKPLSVPALGYTTYYLIKGDKNSCMKQSNGSTIENEFFKIHANRDGSLNITDKINNRDFDEVLILENSGDDGDEYNYSPPEDDFIITNKGKEAKITCEKGGICERLIINMSLMVPKNIEERKQKKTSIAIPIKTVVALKAGCKDIDVKIKIENKAFDTRFRVLFKTGIPSKFSYADEQFGIIKRPNEPEELKVWKAENWSERPSPIYPMQSFVDINNGSYGVSIITKGIREYEIVGEKYDTIAITLFRAIGLLGKPNLKNRPGRASGIGIKTKTSQMQSELEFEFCIYPHAGDVFNAKTAHEAKEYLVPEMLYQVTDKTMFVINRPDKKLPPQKSLMSMESDTIVSAIKKAEGEDGMLIRTFNPDFKNISGGNLVINYEFSSACIADLNEHEIQTVLKNNNKVCLGDFKPCQFKTFIIKE